jgi:hypothetical protein
MKQCNKKHVNFLLFIYVIFLFGCDGNARKNGFFPRENKLVLNEMGVDENIGQVLSIKSTDKFLVITGRNTKTQVLLIDKKTNASYMFGETGEGPGGFLQASDIIPIDGNHIGIYDVQKRLIYNFNIDSIIHENKHYMPAVLMNHITAFSPIQIDRLSENKFVAVSIGAPELSRFILVDENGEIISYEGKLPPKKSEQTSDIVHAFAYWGRITTNPEEQKVAVCTNYAGMIQIYDCSANKAGLIKEHNFFPVDYSENAGNFAVNSQTRWGYLSLDSNNKHIFALYSGLNQVKNPDASFAKSNIIHVFDWYGNPVVQLIVDRQLSQICVDENTLYGYDANIGDIVATNIKGII